MPRLSAIVSGASVLWKGYPKNGMSRAPMDDPGVFITDSLETGRQGESDTHVIARVSFRSTWSLV